MQISPLLNAPPAIQIHASAVAITVVLTLLILPARKGTRRHKFLGHIWVVAMTLTALSSFWISDLKQLHGFSVKRLLSIFVLVSTVRGIYQIRSGNIRGHQRTMRGMVFGGLLLAGVFTLVPGRIMYKVLFTSLGG